MYQLKQFWLLACFAITSFTTAVAAAETCDCSHCGAYGHCRVVCRCVATTEEKSETCFECRSEDFCVPGPSIWCGRKCEAVPLDDDHSDCPLSCCISWNVWKPRSAHVRTKHVLVVHEVKKEVPSFKWEVEYVCDECRRCCADATPIDSAPGDEIVPVSAEAPIEMDASTTDVDEPPAKRSWLARLLGD